jgi:hypothetical protein
MYLFTRSLQLTGPLRDAVGWAAEVTAFVNGSSAHPVSLWSANYGQPIGKVTWSTWVESMADVTSMFATLVADDGYHTVLAKGRDHIAGPAEDELRQALVGGPRDTPPPIGAVTTRTTATIANGQYGAALAWGVEMAGMVEGISGHATSFFADAFGAFGAVTWFTGAPDMTAAEAANNAINGNPDYMGRLSDVATLFLPGSGHRALATRIA